MLSVRFIRKFWGMLPISSINSWNLLHIVLNGEISSILFLKSTDLLATYTSLSFNWSLNQNLLCLFVLIVSCSSNAFKKFLIKVYLNLLAQAHSSPDTTIYSHSSGINPRKRLISSPASIQISKVMVPIFSKMIVLISVSSPLLLILFFLIMFFHITIALNTVKSLMVNSRWFAVKFKSKAFICDVFPIIIGPQQKVYSYPHSILPFNLLKFIHHII